MNTIGLNETQRSGGPNQITNGINLGENAIIKPNPGSLLNIKSPSIQQQSPYFLPEDMLKSPFILSNGLISSPNQALHKYTINGPEEATEKQKVNSKISVKGPPKQREQSILLSTNVSGRVKEYASFLFKSYEGANARGKYTFLTFYFLLNEIEFLMMNLKIGYQNIQSSWEFLMIVFIKIFGVCNIVISTLKIKIISLCW